LANAGISFGNEGGFDIILISTLAISLFVGNFIGVVSISFLSVKLKLAAIPEDINNWQIIGVASLAGVGFTMSIFIASLAFSGNPEIMDSAKAGIFIGSLIAGITGYIILRLSSKNPVVQN